MTVIGVLVTAMRPAEGTQEALRLSELADRAVAEERVIDAAMPEEIVRPSPAAPLTRLGPGVARLSKLLFTVLEWNAVAKRWQLKADVAHSEDSTLEQIVALAVREAVLGQTGGVADASAGYRPPIKP